ncbi:MAG TPA: hypothetical protein VLT82_20610 [Myxococcaceae bacterium]|nr:hypothetical protein [Myxococcaceae bacterium]
MAGSTVPPTEPRITRAYAEIRDQVKDGDVILFRGNVLFSRIIQRISAGRYSHSALILEWGRRWMILQAELIEGVQAVPLSVAVARYHGDVDFYPLTPEARAKVDLPRLAAAAKSALGLRYAKLDLLRVAAHLLFSFPLPRYRRDPEALFCSQYVSRCFRVAGLDLVPESDVGTSPEQIATSRWLRYGGTIRHDPRLNPVRYVDDIPELRTLGRHERRLQPPVAAEPPAVPRPEKPPVPAPPPD